MAPNQLHSLKEAAAYLFGEPKTALTLVSRRTGARRQYYFSRKSDEQRLWVLNEKLQAIGTLESGNGAYHHLVRYHTITPEDRATLEWFLKFLNGRGSPTVEQRFFNQATLYIEMEE